MGVLSKSFNKLTSYLKNLRLTVNDPSKSTAARKGLARLSRASVGGDVDFSAIKLSYDSLYQAYRNNADIYGCVREWRENIGSNGWKLVMHDDEEAEVPYHYKEFLFNIFNFDQPFRYLKDRTLRDFGVTGNAYWHILKNLSGSQVLGFQVLDPRTMKIVADKHGVVLKFVQTSGMTGQSVIFEPDEIVHFKLESDPNNEVFGFSPAETIIWDARTDIAAMIANYSFFENHAVPAAMFIMDDNLSDEQIDLAIARLEATFKGSKNMHKGGVLTGVKEIKTLSLSQKDMEFLAGRRFTTEKICSAYGVPKFFLGYTDAVNNNNAVELRKGAFEGTFAPLEKLIEETINDQVINRLGLFEIEFKFKAQTFEVQENLEKRGIDLYKAGAITLRQLKKMIGREITADDENYPNIDSYIIQQGASAVLLEDVGFSDPDSDYEPDADKESSNFTKSPNHSNPTKRT